MKKKKWGGGIGGDGGRRMPGMADTLGKYSPALSNRSVRKGGREVVVETCGKFETPS